MLWLYKGFDLIISVWEWFTGYNQRQIGKEEQKNADIAANNEILRKELDASVKSVDAADSLRQHKF